MKNTIYTTLEEYCISTGKLYVLEEWDTTKNIGISPQDISYGSGKKVWWKCSFNHSYEKKVCKISESTSKTLCPYCLNKKVLLGFNDLATTHPNLAKEWDYEKNKIKPTEIISGSPKKAWWICPYCNNRWKSVILHRANGTGCPQCLKEQQSSFPEQSIYFYIRRCFPDAINGDCHLGRELDIFIPSLNIAIEYDGETWHKNSNLDINKNLLCAENNVFLYRIREDKCPFIPDTDKLRCFYYKRNNYTELNGIIQSICRDLINFDLDVNIQRDESLIYAQFASLRKEKSLKSEYPDIAKEWDYKKNGSLTPAMVYSKSGRKVWWICDSGHSYQAYVSNRTRLKTGCPICLNRITIEGCNDLTTTHPDLIKEWDYKKNSNLDPRTCRSSSKKKVWWICDAGHSYQTSIISRAKQGSNCPVCMNKIIVPKINDLETICPELVLQWDFEKNYPLIPQMFSHGSTKVVWWTCKKGHSYQASICNKKKTTGCPICSNRKFAEGVNDLLTVFPDIAKDWDYQKNGITADKVHSGSNSKYWWKCSICGCEWETSINHRTGKNSTGCPQCAKARSEKAKYRSVINLDTNEIFDSIKEAASRYNISAANISACCRGIRSNTKGYHWKYYSESDFT